MHSKLLALIIAFALVVVTIPPIKVKAQGLVEYALILVLVVVGPGEFGEFTWSPPETNGSIPQLPSDTAVEWTYVVENVGHAACRQILSAEVVPTPGLNTTTVKTNGVEFFVNGEPIGNLAPCFSNALRTRIAAGKRFPPGLQPANGSEARSLAQQLPWPKVFLTTIVGPNGETRAASGPWSGLEGKHFFLAPLPPG